MGEVVRGSVHYRALFMVGIVLFIASLLINFSAQYVLKKYKKIES
jgi:phosphate transport system permease protein